MGLTTRIFVSSLMLAAILPHVAGDSWRADFRDSRTERLTLNDKSIMQEIQQLKEEQRQMIQAASRPEVDEVNSWRNTAVGGGLRPKR